MTVEKLVNAFLAFYGHNWKSSIPEDHPSAWIEELSDIPIGLLNEALKRARRRVFPPNIGDVRNIVENIAEARMISPAPTRLLLDRGDKPPGWEPLSEEESAALFQKFKSAVAVVNHENRVPRTVAKFEQEARLHKLRQQAVELQKREGPAERKKEG